MWLFGLFVVSAMLAFAQDFTADGLKALDAGDPAAAEPLLRRAAEAGPGDYLTHFNLALALSMQQKDAEAIEEFRKTLALKPGLYEAELNLGMVLLHSKNAPEALPVLKSAAEAKPDVARPHFFYGQALFATGDFAGAAAQYGIAVKADPTPSAAAEQGLKLSLQELEAGKQRAAEQQTPNHLALADQYMQDKQPAKAIAELKAAVASDPANFDVRMDLARALRDQHEYATAAQQFFAATKLRPDSLPAWNDLAAVLVINKDFATAIGALDHARALGKETPGQLYFRAISLDSLKQHKPAVAAYRAFLDSDGGKMPDQEFLARQRIRIIESEMKR